MSILNEHPEIKRLDSEQKLTLIAELWDDLGSQREDLEVSPEIWSEIQRRVAEYKRDPAAAQVTTWAAVKERILSGKRHGSP